MKYKLLAAILPLALTGCMGMGGSRPPVETIRYATGPCFGVCPVYVVTVDSDGVGVFDGRSNVLVEGRRVFVISPAEFQQFKAALAPYRPVGTRELRGANCTSQATDLPTVEVAWSIEERRDILLADFGCDMDQNQAMYDTLAAAPRYLPLDIFVGRR